MYTHKLNEDSILFYLNNNYIGKSVKDVFNSAHFEIIMHNLYIENLSNLNEITLDYILDIFKLNKVSHVTFRILENKDNIKILTDKNFYLVSTLNTYELNQLSDLQLNNNNLTVREARKEDVLRLKEIAQKAFEIDRFHKDLNLNKEKSDLYYSKWIENSVNGYADKVFVSVQNDKVAGFNTIKIKEQGVIDLTAVDFNYRGQGHYKSLIDESIKFIRLHKSILRIGTQSDNVPVNKYWTKIGAKLITSENVFHCYIR